MAIDIVIGRRTVDHLIAVLAAVCLGLGGYAHRPASSVVNGIT